MQRTQAQKSQVRQETSRDGGPGLALPRGRDCVRRGLQGTPPGALSREVLRALFRSSYWSRGEQARQISRFSALHKRARARPGLSARGGCISECWASCPPSCPAGFIPGFPLVLFLVFTRCWKELDPALPRFPTGGEQPQCAAPGKLVLPLGLAPRPPAMGG